MARFLSAVPTGRAGNSIEPGSWSEEPVFLKRSPLLINDLSIHTARWGILKNLNKRLKYYLTPSLNVLQCSSTGRKSGPLSDACAPVEVKSGRSPHVICG